MTREEVLKEREAAVAHADLLERLGDYDANAQGIRRNAKSLAKVWQHLLDRMPRRA